MSSLDEQDHSLPTDQDDYALAVLTPPDCSVSVVADGHSVLSHASKFGAVLVPKRLRQSPPGAMRLSEDAWLQQEKQPPEPPPPPPLPDIENLVVSALAEPDGEAIGTERTRGVPGLNSDCQAQSGLGHDDAVDAGERLVCFRRLLENSIGHRLPACDDVEHLPIDLLRAFLHGPAGFQGSTDGPAARKALDANLSRVCHPPPKFPLAEGFVGECAGDNGKNVENDDTSVPAVASLKTRGSASRKKRPIEEEAEAPVPEEGRLLAPANSKKQSIDEAAKAFVPEEGRLPALRC